MLRPENTDFRYFTARTATSKNRLQKYAQYTIKVTPLNAFTKPKKPAHVPIPLYFLVFRSRAHIDSLRAYAHGFY
jgi:hypothetical protein